MWWCEHYKRPLKDPLLQEYTLEELAYEYYMVNEKDVYREEMAKDEADKIEEAKLQDEEDWADMMEAQFDEQVEEPKKPEKKEEPPKPVDPRLDPKNIEWMEKHIEENKLFFGEDFGEDVGISFEEDPKKGK